MLAALLLALPLAADPVEESNTSAFKPVGRWALVVGVSDYDFLPDLSFADDDAAAFAESLVVDHGYQPDAVRLMTEEAEDPFLRPSSEYVMRTLRQMLDDPRRSPSDLFVFYFSGHGVGTEGGDYLLPRGADVSTAADVGLEVKEIVELLREEGARNTLFVMDACREGEERTPFGRWLIDLPEDERVAVLLSCEPGGRSKQSRRLGHGLFTHYLLDGTRTRKAADDLIGAVWASRLGEYVSEQVAEHTALDDPPQVPRTLVEPTRDVLLGVLPQGTEGFVPSEELIEYVEAVAPRSSQSSLACLAVEWFAMGDHEACANLLDALSQRQELEPALLFAHATSLGALGRAAEARRALATLQEQHAGTYYALAATIEDPSRSASDEQRGRAALELLRNHQPLSADVVRQVIHTLLLGLPSAEALAALDELAASLEEGSQARHLVEANLRRVRGDVDGMFEAYELALTIPGTIDRDELWYELATMLARFRRYDEALAMLTDAVESSATPGPWLVQRGLLWADLGERERGKADALAALDHPLAPEELLNAVSILGASVKDEGVPERVVELAGRHRRAWQARIAEVIATTPGDELSQKLEDLVHLAANPSQFVSGMVDALVRVCLDLVAEERMTVAELQTFYWDCITTIAPLAGEFGIDEAPWQTLERIAVEAGGFVELRALLDVHLSPHVEARTLPATLAATYAVACLNTGDLERMREIQLMLAEGTRVAANIAMFEAAVLASSGDLDEARRALSAIVESEVPSDSFALAVTQIAALIEARAGDRERAIELLEGATRGTPFGDALAAHAFLLCGLPAPAEPILESIAARRGGIFAFVERPALDALVELMDDRSQSLAYAQRCAFELAGNPLGYRSSFAEIPGVGPFAGVQRFELIDDQTASGEPEPAGQLFLFVQPDGKAEGQVSFRGDLNGIVSGTVDAYGNLTARLRSTGEDPQVSELRLKLPTKAAVEEHAPLREFGVYLVWIPESGLVRRVRALRQD